MTTPVSVERSRFDRGYTNGSDRFMEAGSFLERGYTHREIGRRLDSPA